MADRIKRSLGFVLLFLAKGESINLSLSSAYRRPLGVAGEVFNHVIWDLMVEMSVSSFTTYNSFAFLWMNLTSNLFEHLWRRMGCHSEIGYLARAFFNEPFLKKLVEILQVVVNGVEPYPMSIMNRKGIQNEDPDDL